MVVPGGTVVVSVVRTIVLGGRDGGGQGTGGSRQSGGCIKLRNVITYTYICTVEYYSVTCVITAPLAGLIVTTVILL